MERRLKTIIATTDPVLLNYAETLLKSEGIPHFTLDQHQSLVDGSIGVIPRRLCVLEEDFGEAVEVLKSAELGHEIYAS